MCRKKPWSNELDGAVKVPSRPNLKRFSGPEVEGTLHCWQNCTKEADGHSHKQFWVMERWWKWADFAFRGPILNDKKKKFTFNLIVSTEKHSREKITTWMRLKWKKKKLANGHKLRLPNTRISSLGLRVKWATFRYHRGQLKQETVTVQPIKGHF